MAQGGGESLLSTPAAGLMSRSSGQRASAPHPAGRFLPTAQMTLPCCRLQAASVNIPSLILPVPSPHTAYIKRTEAASVVPHGGEEGGGRGDVEKMRWVQEAAFEARELIMFVP